MSSNEKLLTVLIESDLATGVLRVAALEGGGRKEGVAWRIYSKGNSL